MGIPFQVTAESVENHDETGGIVFRFINLIKKAADNTGNSMKEAVKEIAVIKEKRAQKFINGKYTMTVRDMKQFKRHFSCSFHSIFRATGGTKAALTAERNEFKFPTVRAGIHSPTVRWITTVDHFIDVLHFAATWMEGIFDFFIIVCENLL